MSWGYLVRVDKGITSGIFPSQEAQTHAEEDAWMADSLHGLYLTLHCLETGWRLKAKGQHEAVGKTTKQTVILWSCLERLLSDQ